MTDLREAAQMALDALDSDNPDIQLRAATHLRAALAQPKQEPVAWITGGGKGELWWHQSVKFDDDGNLIGENPDDIPLYAAPPQREWQGLTDEERKDIFKACGVGDRGYVAAMVEAKLKEKNT